MPRIPLSQDEVNAVKGKILEAALQIITDDGFRNLSMRKIAKYLGITATTIYNYYTNVDDLYFHIRMHGFELLYRRFYELYVSYSVPAERLYAMIKGYVKFSLEYPDFYDVMYVNRKVPKYLEVIGTEIEQVASEEKEMALKPFLLVMDTLKSMSECDPAFSDEAILYKATQLWCDLNGILSLHNSRLLREVNENVDALVERLVEDVASRHGGRFK